MAILYPYDLGDKMLYTTNSFTVNYPIEEADVVFVGIPFVSGSLSRPALYGPVMVRESIKLKEDYVDGKNIFEKLKICDIGDIEVVPGSFELTSERIKDTVQSIKQTNEKAFPIFIGGDHSITLPITEALKPKTIIQFDAHADLRSEYLGNKYMQQTWAFHASKFARIIQVGVNSLNREEYEYSKQSENVKNVSIGELKGMKFEGPVHLTIDIDVLDASYVETGLPEGKMKLDELFDALKNIDCDSMDIVEIADDKLPSKTGFIAADIIKTILAKKV